MNPSRGFTLVEMMIVLMITGVVVMLGARIWMSDIRTAKMEILAAESQALLQHIDDFRRRGNFSGIDASDGSYQYTYGTLPNGTSLGQFELLSGIQTGIGTNPWGNAYTLEVTQFTVGVTSSVPYDLRGYKDADQVIWDQANSRTVVTFSSIEEGSPLDPSILARKSVYDEPYR